MPTLSPSKISTYLACPVKYRWTYVDGRGRLYLRSKAAYSFGNTLHRVLELFHEAAREGVPTVDAVLATYEESWIDAGFSTPDEMVEAFGEGKEIISAYVDDYAREAATAQTLYLEKTLSKKFETFRLVGRLDRVDEHEDGTLEIIDYKTGRSQVSEEDVHEDLAMGIYQLLLAHAHPGRPVKATLVALRTKNRATSSLSPEELDQFEADLQTTAHWMLSADWLEYEPRLKPLCQGCDFVPLCGKHPEFAEAWAARQQSQMPE